MTVDETFCEPFDSVNDGSDTNTHHVDLSPPMNVVDSPFCWIYVASADDDFCMRKLENQILWNFGLDKLRIDSLSTKEGTAYKSFKVSVPNDFVSQMLDHRKWPRSYYVRRFEESKKVFRLGSATRTRRKNSNFVHNPLKLRV